MHQPEVWPTCHALLGQELSCWVVLTYTKQISFISGNLGLSKMGCPQKLVVSLLLMMSQSAGYHHGELDKHMSTKHDQATINPYD